MECMKRNQKAFYYASFVSEEAIEDTAGEYEIKYSKPIKLYGNISFDHGSTETMMFGNSLDYDATIVFKPTIDINENGIIWFGVVPDSENKIPHNYEIKSVIPTLNHVVVAIKRVNIG